MRVDTTHYCSLDSGGQRVKGLKQSGPSIRAVKLTKMQLNVGVPRNLRVNTTIVRRGTEIHCVNVVFSPLIASLHGYFLRIRFVTFPEELSAVYIFEL